MLSTVQEGDISMNKVNQNVKCGNCKSALNESADLPVAKRKPCPRCGSLSRHFEVLIESKLFVTSKLRMKARRGGKGKPFIDTTKGDDIHRKTGKWMKLERIINRENDLYTEVVTDPTTGKIVYKCEEPLSQHKGHGSAKLRR